MTRLSLLFACLAPLAMWGQTISFLPPVSVSGGGARVVSTCSGCVVVADFNGDGKLDLVVNVLTPAPQGTVLLGNGDGTFRPNWSSSNISPGPLQVGDFNGDGKPDLISGNQIFLGIGNGALGNPLTVSNCVSGGLVADFNRDGKTDILCGISALLSNGDGTFRVAGTAGSVAMESAQLVADFNEDGIPDVLLLQLSGNLAVVLGHGDGTFGTEIILNYALLPQTSANFLLGDFNGDGKVDLIDFSLRGTTIDFLPGKGDGTFGTLVQTDISADPAPAAMTAVGDFNKDGKLDFVAGDAIYAGNGDGTFRFPVFFGPTAYPCGAARTGAGGNMAGCDYLHSSTTVGDFNGDGLADLATYSVIEPGASEAEFFYSEVDIDVLLNDSPGNGFGTAGVNPASSTLPVGSGSIVSAYGVNLAPTTAVNTTIPASTTLGGIRLHIRDRSHTADSLAPLLYVSPTQINYILISTDPYAWVDIERVGQPYVPQGMTVPIAAVAPGFFVYPYTTGAPGYLSLYGTGFAQASTSLSTCTVGNTAVRVTYAGPEIQIAGLDQVNILLPGGLAGAGVQPVTCFLQTVTGASEISNSVNVTFR